MNRITIDNIGAKVLRARKLKCLSQQELADKAGVSLRTVQRIENSNTQPHPHTLSTISRVLEIDFTKVNESESDFGVGPVKWILTSCLLPVIPIISNLLIPGWLYFKNHDSPQMKTWGSRILTFQLFWTVTTTIMIILTPPLALLIFDTTNPGKFYPVLFVYMCSVLFNFIVMSFAANAFYKNKHGFIERFPSIF